MSSESSRTCQNCKESFTIEPEDFAFYKKMNIPLPHLCFNCRYAERITLRNPMKLWSHQCQCGGAASINGIYANTTTHTHGSEPCATSFQTAYSPDRQDIIYCGECYQQEVVYGALDSVTPNGTLIML